MAERSADEQLQSIERLLDERVGDHGMEGGSLADSVADVIDAFELWSELAIKRLHEIHRLQGEECDSCSKYLDARHA